MHFRTIKDAAAYFKAADPGTSITETAIRTLVRSGKIKSTRIGKKYTVTVEAIEEFFAGQNDETDDVVLKLQPTKWKIT